MSFILNTIISNANNTLYTYNVSICCRRDREANVVHVHVYACRRRSNIAPFTRLIRRQLNAVPLDHVHGATPPLNSRDSNPIAASNKKYLPKWQTSLERRVKNGGRETLGVWKIAKYRYTGRIQTGRNGLRPNGLRRGKKEEKNKRVRRYG